MTARASAADYTGPGPITRRDRHGRIVVEYADGTITVDEPVNPRHPTAHQWFTGTKSGLLATWGTRQAAIDKARQDGTLLGQVTPITVAALRAILEQADPDATLVVLTDPTGNLLPGLVPGHVPTSTQRHPQGPESDATGDLVPAPANESQIDTGAHT